MPVSTILLVNLFELVYIQTVVIVPALNTTFSLFVIVILIRLILVGGAFSGFRNSILPSISLPVIQLLFSLNNLISKKEINAPELVRKESVN